MFFSAFLKLVAEGDLSAVSVPEMARFALRRKRAVRFYSAESGNRIENGLSAFVPYLARKRVTSHHCGGSWSSIEPLGNSASGGTGSDGEIIVLGRDSGLITEILSAEMENAPQAGDLFDYPRCCVAGYSSLAKSGAEWPAELKRRSAPDGTAKTNRIPTDWGGLSPIGELFPCSLSCSMAAAIGFDGWDALRRLGLYQLASRLIVDATSWFRIEPSGRALPSSPTDPGAMQFAW